MAGRSASELQRSASHLTQVRRHGYTCIALPPWLPLCRCAAGCAKSTLRVPRPKRQWPECSSG